MNRPRLSPPQVFTMISLLLIIVMVLGVGFTRSSFYGQAIIDRESGLIYDMVNALVLQQEQEQQLDRSDLVDYQRDLSQQRLENTFNTLMKLSGVTLIKVFRPDKTIVWSSESSLIGKYFVTQHPTDLESALHGKARAVFISGNRTIATAYTIPRLSLIEFYVPFSLAKQPQASNEPVSGVLAIYRFPQGLNQTIQEGILILWLVTGLGGLILFGALYTLFRSVYYRQREAESQFAKLSSDYERLVQIEKLSALGQMVSEIAHQLNSPLVGVVNLAELAEREVDDPSRTKELLEEIRKAGDHCRGFVQRMLRFNHVASFVPQTVELKAQIEETITFFQQSMDTNPMVTLEVPEEDVMLEVDPVLIRHALFNLIHNAVQAEPAKPVDVALASEQRGAVSGWRISVSDSGAGIPAAVATKLFTPFFTTRSGGTGLGLTVAQHIALQHGGSIHAENKQGGGAMFSIWLPSPQREQT